MKKPLDPLTKANLAYCIELGVFSLVFMTLGVLFLTGVIAVADWKKWAFTLLTTAGGVWLIIDLIWTSVSPKRRAKNCLLDKILVAPMGIAVLCFDIVTYVNGWLLSVDGALYIAIGLGVALCYYSVVYAFQAFYHWKHPLPALIEAAEEDAKAEAEEAQKAALASQEETKESEAGN